MSKPILIKILILLLVITYAVLIVSKSRDLLHTYEEGNSQLMELFHKDIELIRSGENELSDARLASLMEQALMRDAELGVIDGLFIYLYLTLAFYFLMSCLYLYYLPKNKI